MNSAMLKKTEQGIHITGRQGEGKETTLLGARLSSFYHMYIYPLVYWSISKVSPSHSKSLDLPWTMWRSTMDNMVVISNHKVG